MNNIKKKKKNSKIRKAHIILNFKVNLLDEEENRIEYYSIISK